MVQFFFLHIQCHTWRKWMKARILCFIDFCLKKKLWSWSSYNYLQFSEGDKLSSIQLTAYKIIFHDTDLVICICLEINHTLLAFDWNFLKFMYDYSKSPLPPPSISLLRPHINDFQSNIKKNLSHLLIRYIVLISNYQGDSLDRFSL